jgi:glycosyltransferase involved in cell wall biosynthesis
VDDGSTDGTTAQLHDMARRDARLRVLTGERLGPSGARNLGLRAATQPIIAFLDGDDVWPRDKVERQMRRLAAADRPDVVSGLIRRFRRLEPRTQTPADETGETMAHANLGACLFRREVFDTVGIFDERLRHCEDVDLMFRILEAELKLVIMPEVTLFYRIRPGSLTETRANESEKESSALNVLRLSLGRRRRAGRTRDLPPFTDLIEQ